MSYFHYLAVRFTEHEGIPKSVSLVGTRDFVNYHWGGGPSYTTELPDWEVAKDYGIPADDDAEDAIIASFDKDFPPQPYDIEQWTFKQVDGFISPEGLFYRCGYQGHTGLAADLLNMLSVPANPFSLESCLIDLGWLSVRYGFIASKRKLPTGPQSEFLNKLIEQNAASEKYQANVRQYFEYAVQRKYKRANE